MLASDRSPGLAAQAASRLVNTASSPACSHADVAVADAMSLPYRSGTFDGVLCIAVSLVTWGAALKPGKAAVACVPLH